MTTEAVDEDNYKGTVSMKIGPVVTNFKGTIQIVERNVETRVLVLTGNGMDAKGKGSARMRLEGTLTELDGGRTAVETRMEISVVGRLAQFGTRLMGDVSKRLFEKFVECFAASVEPVAVEAPTEASEASASTTETVAEKTDVPPAVATDSPPTEAEPVKALPLLFQALWSAIKRLFSRSKEPADHS